MRCTSLFNSTIGPIKGKGFLFLNALRQSTLSDSKVLFIPLIKRGTKFAPHLQCSEIEEPDLQCSETERLVLQSYGSLWQRWKKYFSFCESGIKVKYFLPIFHSFDKVLALKAV